MGGGEALAVTSLCVVSVLNTTNIRQENVATTIALTAVQKWTVNKMQLKYILLIIIALGFTLNITGALLADTQFKHKKLCDVMCKAGSIIAYVAVVILLFGVLVPGIGSKASK